MPLVESQTLELKRELGDLHGLLKTFCAFANTHGGKLLLGVDDHGLTVGIPQAELDQTQQRIAQALRQLNPVPLYSIGILEMDGARIIQIEVEPMMYGALCSYQGVIYFRHGSSTERAEGHALQELLAKRRIIDFEQTISNVRLEAVDLVALEEYMLARSPSLAFERERAASYLVSLGVMHQMEGGRLNNAGVMFFHPRPAEIIPQFEIKLARFKGTAPVQILDASFLSRPMLRLLAEAEAFLVRNTRTAFAYEGLDRKEVPEYPRNVLREALVNAVAHRNYFDPNAIQINIFDDRIEVLNPGALPEGLRLEDLGSYSVQRNPVVYKLLRDVRKVEGLATGIPKIRETLGEQGFPAPLFEELGGKFFRLTIRNREGALPEWISPRQKRGLALLEKSGTISTAQYAEANGISRTAALADISELIDRGLLEKSGQTKGSKYRLVKK